MQRLALSTNQAAIFESAIIRGGDPCIMTSSSMQRPSVSALFISSMTVCAYAFYRLVKYQCFTFNFVTFFHHRRVLRWRCMVDTLALPFEQVWSVVERVLVAVVAFKTKVIFYSFQPILSNHFQIGECAEFFCIFLCHGEANTDSVSPCPAKETVHLLPIRVKKLPTCK